jgi:TonB family protein
MFNVLIASGRIKAPRPFGGVVASVVAHGALLAALLLGSRPAIHVASEFEQRIAEYLFPKDRAPEIGDRTFDQLRIPGGLTESPSSVGGAGPPAGRDGQRKTNDPLKQHVDQPVAGSTGTPDLIAQQQKIAESLGAFALLDVDSGAVRDPHSAAPAYPKDMEERGIEGAVRVRFVVDSTGRIDLSTIKVLESTNESFAREVRAALPDMRFRPAMIGAHPVRQLSEQGFAFKVLLKHDSATGKPRP